MCLYILIIFSIFVLTVILNIFYGKQKINEEFALLKQLKDDSSCTIDVSYLSSIIDYFDIIKNVRNNLKTLLDGNYQNQGINDSLAIDAIKLIKLREKFLEMKYCLPANESIPLIGKIFSSIVPKNDYIKMFVDSLNSINKL